MHFACIVLPTISSNWVDGETVELESEIKKYELLLVAVGVFLLHLLWSCVPVVL